MSVDRETVLGTAGLMVLTALSPRLTRWMTWPVGRGPRASAVNVALTTAVQFAARQWLRPWVARVEADRRTLEGRLGREATFEELPAFRSRASDPA
jgi:hypothetical protein